MEIRGEGSIEQMEKGKPRSRCRRWRLWAYTDRGRRSRVVRGTYSQARDALDGFLGELESKTGSADTFRAYAERWRRWRESSGTVQRSTTYNDRYHVAFLDAYIGDAVIDNLDPPACRDALARMLDGHSGTYVNKVYCTWKMVMRSAVADGVIASDPLDRVKPPKVDTSEREWLAPDDLDGFVAKVRAMPVDGRTMALRYIAGLGLRRGEAVALRESDLSLSDGSGVLSVGRAYKEKDGSVGEPKTGAGRRLLPMPSWLVDDTIAWLELKRALGFPPTWLCCNTEGGLLRTQNLYKWWTVHRAALGADGLTLHQLRHSNLSMMARHANVFDLQSYAGWTSIEPAKVYIHSDLDSLASAVREAASQSHGQSHEKKQASGLTV